MESPLKYLTLEKLLDESGVNKQKYEKVFQKEGITIERLKKLFEMNNNSMLDAM
jgi:hypothetical protein